MSKPLHGRNFAHRAVGILLQGGLITQESAPAALDALLSLNPNVYASRDRAMHAPMTCKDCGKRARRHPVRPDQCPECYRRATARIRRLGEYHATIKTDPELLEKHREQSRERMRRYYERKRIEKADKPSRPRGRPRKEEPEMPTTGSREVTFAGVSGLPRAGKKPAPTVPIQSSVIIQRLAPLESCSYCFRKFRGEGRYCGPACEDKATRPAGNDGTYWSKSYTSKK